MNEVLQTVNQYVEIDQLMVYLMPFTYAFVGWMTNVVALKMTFYPLEFVGIKPFLGWQGIIPRKAHKMASKSVDVITERLLKIEEVFDKVDPRQVEKEIGPMLNQVTQDVIKDVVDDINPRLWELLPDPVRQQINDQARAETSRTIEKIIHDIRANIYHVFDLKNLVLKSLTGSNVVLIVEMFQTVGAPEFKFIERSGLYFGFILGLIQMAIWSLLPIWWTLPIQGIIVGYVTNYLALKMIFRPQEEKQIFGIKYQGLFHRRQDAVSKEYSRLVAERILTPRKIMAEILYGRAANDVYNVIRKAVAFGVEASANLARPFLSFTMGTDKYEQIKTYIVAKLTDLAPKSSKQLEEYMYTAMDLEETMYTRMRALTPQEFETILRSAFQEDELLLILVGAFLGAMVGLAQGFYFMV